MPSFKLFRSAVCISLCLLGVGLDSLANAMPLVSDQFIRTAQSEALTAPLAVFGGVSTTQQWSGLIEFIVSGMGKNWQAPEGTTDAFYYFLPESPGPPLGERNWGLLISSTGCSAGLECGAPSILHSLEFTEDVGYVSPTPDSFAEQPGRGHVMPYRADHDYHFVIDVGATPRILTLGYGDGGVYDNSGQFTLEMFAVTPRSIPEPATLALLGVALGRLGFVHRRALHYSAGANIGDRRSEEE